MRIVGSAMPGYYAGRFPIDGGVTTVYASTLKDGVLVEGGERVFVSPADGAGFVAALRDAGARLSCAAGARRNAHDGVRVRPCERVHLTSRHALLTSQQGG
ncbi:MAG: PH domain-containing protein [Acidobacteriota bacterium]